VDSRLRSLGEATQLYLQASRAVCDGIDGKQRGRHLETQILFKCRQIIIDCFFYHIQRVRRIFQNTHMVSRASLLTDGAILEY
jgi:hypothetical protein